MCWNELARYIIIKLSDFFFKDLFLYGPKKCILTSLWVGMHLYQNTKLNHRARGVTFICPILWYLFYYNLYITYWWHTAMQYFNNATLVLTLKLRQLFISNIYGVTDLINSLLITCTHQWYGINEPYISFLGQVPVTLSAFFFFLKFWLAFYVQ